MVRCSSSKIIAKLSKGDIERAGSAPNRRILAFFVCRHCFLHIIFVVDASFHSITTNGRQRCGLKAEESGFGDRYPRVTDNPAVDVSGLWIALVGEGPCPPPLSTIHLPLLEDKTTR